MPPQNVKKLSFQGDIEMNIDEEWAKIFKPDQQNFHMRLLLLASPAFFDHLSSLQNHHAHLWLTLPEYLCLLGHTLLQFFLIVNAFQSQWDLFSQISVACNTCQPVLENNHFNNCDYTFSVRVLQHIWLLTLAKLSELIKFYPPDFREK